MLLAEDKRTLLHLARRALDNYLAARDLPPYETDSPALLEQRAAFVTLRRRDTDILRGCRGEYIARRRLVESVMNMAIAAATDDPRFPPVTVDEVPLLHIEISALHPMVPIRPEDVEVGRHGLLITKRGSAGLLLPEVAIGYGWDREAFLKAVCRKAGLSDNAWKERDVALYGFEAEVWCE
jgi:AmmeMemoRadiSam system protein A